MHCFTLSMLFNVFLLCLLSVHSTTSASFPNPPQKPPANASPDEQALFWKLLHNYYAIIARPRFGKRSESMSVRVNRPAVLAIVEDTVLPVSSSSSEDQYGSLSEEDARLMMDRLYNLGSLHQSDQRRRRR